MIARVLALVGAAAVCAACSSTVSGSGTAGTGRPSTPTATQPAPSSPTGFPSSPAATGGLTEAQAQAALLTAAEIGPGFTATAPATEDTPLPCTPNAPTLAQRFPPQVKVQSGFAAAAGAVQFAEEIETFADEATVRRALSAGAKGLSCGTATITSGSTSVEVTIDGPTDLTDQLIAQVDQCALWSLSSSVIDATLIVAQIGRHLIVLSFGSAPSVDTSTLPKIETVTNDALQKVLDAA